LRPDWPDARITHTLPATIQRTPSRERIDG
jgi:hypothetical protein